MLTLFEVPDQSHWSLHLGQSRYHPEEFVGDIIMKIQYYWHHIRPTKLESRGQTLNLELSTVLVLMKNKEMPALWMTPTF